MVLVHGMVANSIGRGAIGPGALGLVLGHGLLARGGHGPQKRGPISMKDRWSATSGASGSVMGSVAPYP